MKFEVWHAFVIGAVLSWGVYVPVLHEGQTLLGGRPSQGALRAFLCVGIAYFITAVLIPLGLFFLNMTAGEPLDFTRDGVFNTQGLVYALLGGIAGAAGALCIVLSIKNGGSPMFIAPLVFAGAPIVNTLVSLAWKTRHVPGPLFFVGIVLAAVGAGLVLYSKADLDQKLKQHPPATTEEARAAPVNPNGNPNVTGQEGPPVTPAEAVTRLDTVMAHLWMVRTFLKHADEIQEDADMLDVPRTVFDYVRAVEPSRERNDLKEYLHRTRAKLSKLRRAAEYFAAEHRRVSDHTNFQMSALSLSGCVRQIEEILSRVDKPAESVQEN